MKNIHLLPTDKPSKIFYIAENFHLEKGQLIEPKSYHNVYITSDEEIKEWFIVNGINGYSQPMKYSVMFPKDKFPNGHDKNKLNLLSIILTTDQDLIKDGVQAISDEFLEWFVKNPSCEEVKVADYGNVLFDDKVFYMYKIIIPQEEPKQSIQEFIEQHGITEQQLIDGYKQGLDLIFKNASKITKQEEPKQELPQLGTKEFNNLAAYFFGGKPNTFKKINEQTEPKQETLEEAAEKWNEKQTTLEFGKPHNAPNRIKAFIEGAKWQAERMYSEEEVLDIINSFEKLCYNYQNNKDWFPAKKSEWFEQFKKK